MNADAVDRQKPAKTDRRVIRTRAAIHEALISLITEMPYDKITITALAQRANIDRKTFYTHYASIDELLEDVIKQRLHTNIGNINLTEFYDDPARFTRDLLFAFEAALPLTVDERRSALEHMPINRILKYWTAATKENLISQVGPLPPDAQRRIDVVLDFFLGGLFNVYTRWLKEPDQLSLDTVLELLSEGVTKGIAGIMGVYSHPSRPA